MPQAFSEIVREAVDQGITSVLGEKVSMAFNFYIDPSIAGANPEGFERVVRKLFGEQAVRVLNGIIVELSATVGLSRRDWETLAACVNEAKVHYQREESPSASTA